MYTLHLGNSLQLLPTLPANSIDAIVCDPPYELGFMGKSWDASGIAYNVTLWKEAMRVLKPGGHLLAFSGSRTYHRMTSAIEDAGFEIRDQIMWVYGSGFPKSLDVSKAIDKAAGAEREVVGVSPHAANRQASEGYDGWTGNDTRCITAPATEAAKQWQGWGTALKPAHEPICVARKPLTGTVAANVLAHGTGALNIDGCRVGSEIRFNAPAGNVAGGNSLNMSAVGMPVDAEGRECTGRWPANLIHDGSEEVLALFPETRARGNVTPTKSGTGMFNTESSEQDTFGGDAGSAARFFYCAKTSKKDRNEGLDSEPDRVLAVSNQAKAELARGNMHTGNSGFDTARVCKNNHPTVKPTDLMRYLCRLVTPPGGTVLDPFMGSGSTGKAAVLEGFRFIGIEMSEEYMAIAAARIEAAFESTIAYMI